ncbi:MAG: KilA-N domain-containing protein [Saprospiraceae bacterium]|nr:KilA-N domain-containing protein [Saprospiraceae bacterium]MCF8248769.1 KilA-N domain-containing protein [Saprospiraceae bacterium]MCF8278741.1 KilA-N domain-containing protein [Bacteroidales bacterium]MCF8310541.1 KilA-N domain-containing protein [Saprospiraceae bacterium]MCF8439100.1 KilA-N domain-containing protein [Saprospiraceae bacterium]
MALKQNTIKVQDIEVRLQQHDTGAYVSLTDIASNGRSPANDIIKNYLRNRSNIEFLGLWESLNNPDFNSVDFHRIRTETGLSDFILSVKDWIDLTNAIGITAKAGRYGGTYAHQDIAVQFASWLNPSFYLFLIREFQRLKEDESTRLETNWSLRRQIAKTNWHIHTNAVRENLVPLIDWNTNKEAIHQASEADLLNLAVFGVTARQWRTANPDVKDNIRDHATVEQLLVLSNLQSLNSKLLQWASPKDQRLEILNTQLENKWKSLSKPAAWTRSRSWSS